MAGGSRSVGQGASWDRTEVIKVTLQKSPVVGLGLKIAVVAAGNPVTLNVKLSVKPVFLEMFTV